MDMGFHAHAGGFLTKDQFAGEKKYPLRLFFCEECYAVQVADVIEPDVLFKDYFYLSSSIGTLRSHFEKYAADIYSRFLPKTVLEIGCNDGFLLKRFADHGSACVGVDPASNVVATIGDHRLRIINAYFTEDIDESADLIVANNVFAHIPDINGATRAVRKCLNKDGVFIFEVHYLGKMIAETQYDIIYNEHLYYHSLLSLQKHFERHGMQIFDVEPIKLHAGSMRYYVCKDHRKPHNSVKKLQMAEMEQRLFSIETYQAFAARAFLHAAELNGFVASLGNVEIAGYGASGRANTIMQFANVYPDYMVDDAPKKWGYYTPGSHIPIQREIGNPDYTMIFAWPFCEEILPKVSGPVIIPLPRVQMIESGRKLAV